MNRSENIIKRLFIPRIFGEGSNFNGEFETERQRVHKVVDKYFTKVDFFDNCYMVDKTNLINLAINQRINRVGECFILSYFYGIFDQDYQIVHGVKEGGGNHSWCEKGNIFYDPSDNHRVGNKKLIYKQDNIDLNSIVRYSVGEATENIAKYGRFGFWSDGKSREVKPEKQACLRNCFGTLQENYSRLENFLWWRDESGLLKFELKLQGEEKQVFLP